MQFTDEFLELLAKGLIGKGVLAVAVESPAETDQEPEEAEEGSGAAVDASPHTRMQWLLTKIGLWEGHDRLGRNGGQGQDGF